MDKRDSELHGQPVDERSALLETELNLPPDAADSAARDRTSPNSMRKPASDDVELDRIAAAQEQNAANDAEHAKHS